MKAVIAALLVAAFAHAETQQERGKRVVNEALQALGGEKFRTMKDRVETGRAYSFYREQLRGLAFARITTKYTQSSGHPPRHPAQLERQAFGKDEDQIVVFPGEGKGYILTYRGAKPLPNDRLLRYDESTLRNVLYILRMRLDEPDMTFVSRGTDVIDNNPVELVEIADSENRSTTVAFHRTTKLPFRQVFDYRDPKTKERIEEIMYFSKWRDVGGGVMWPYHMERVRNGEKVFEIFSETVAVNQNVPDAAFRLPGNLKILPPDRT
ncbi:MAG TPA: hypothetical protein VFL57_17340 [Bryobacteraceae bacterium]|nr:hypothetical protein [Bryobacteraceae bacterium]